MGKKVNLLRDIAITFYAGIVFCFVVTSIFSKLFYKNKEYNEDEHPVQIIYTYK